ncbi:hypothetical protein GCM10022222_51510 [Amycolatopsis ultiminotia]|uniref:Uncharacterized protein n=1 Tax=Amycolatopsis ultiminotia TaxID=543629 RepID=A0ABP6X4N0_9PSEU
MQEVVTLGEVAREGHPAAVIVCCLFPLMILVMGLLRRARRPIPAPRGRPTVKDVETRLQRQAQQNYEVQAAIRDRRAAEFRARAERTAAERDEEIMSVIPEVEDIAVVPLQASPVRRYHPDAGMRPREQVTRGS